MPKCCRKNCIHVNGTTKTSIPKAAFFNDTGPNKIQRQNMNFMKQTYNRHDYYFTSWIYSKIVHSRHAKTPIPSNSLDSITGQFKPIVLLPPTVIKDYNKYMEGTDMIDQRYIYYRFGY